MYTVRFDSQGGSGVSSKTAAYGKTVSAPANPTKTGHTFAGRYTAASGGTKATFPLTVKANTTLYARWTPKTYQLSFNSHGGTSVKAKSAAYGKTVSAPGNPTKTGHTFAGRYTAASGGKKVTFPYKLTGNVTLHARWTAFSSVTPGGLKAASAGYNSVKLTWSAEPGASGYRIYRSASAKGSYTLIKTTTSLSFTNGGLTSGKTYYYKIRAYQTKGSSKIESKMMAAVSAKPVPAAPGKPKTAKLSGNKVKLSWSSVSGRADTKSFVRHPQAERLRP